MQAVPSHSRSQMGGLLKTTAVSWRARRAWFLAALAIMCMAVIASAAPPASANEGPFCPASGTIGLQAYSTPGDRCIWAYHSEVLMVEYLNAFEIAHSCAVLKPNSNGSGGDVGLPAACPNNNGPAMVEFGVHGYPGYATGINHSPNYHTGFDGYLRYAS
jgi:hypothetical protein